MKFFWRRATTTFVHCYADGYPGTDGGTVSAICSRKVPLVASHKRTDGPVCSGCMQALERIYHAATDAYREADDLSTLGPRPGDGEGR